MVFCAGSGIMVPGVRKMKAIALTPEHLALLASYHLEGLPGPCCTGVVYRPGETVTREGAPIECLLLVVRGLAKVCRTAPNGKNLILCYYLSSGVVGEIELLTQQPPATTTVTAVSSFECVRVDLRSCLAELDRNLPFVRMLGAGLAEKLCASSDSCVLAALCTAEERLCAYILKNAPQGLFADVLSDVACSIGTSYRHVLRLLAGLCADGVLEKTPAGFRIRAPEELARRAQREGPG